MTLAEVIERLEALDADATIYAARPWSADARAVVAVEPEDGSMPETAASLDYFLEVDVAVRRLSSAAPALRQKQRRRANGRRCRYGRDRSVCGRPCPLTRRPRACSAERLFPWGSNFSRERVGARARLPVTDGAARVTVCGAREAATEAGLRPPTRVHGPYGKLRGGDVRRWLRCR